MRSTILAVVALLLGAGAAAQQPQTKTPAETSQDSGGPAEHDHAKMMERGEKGMAFSQTATTHHFLLKSNGGVIQVTVNDPKDTAKRDEIRMHLQPIAHLFSAGDFDIPMFIHDQVPPGVPEMKKLNSKIHYDYGDIADGGKMVISSADAAAVSAIQKFLRFQISEHETGDPTTVK
ncbi:MAG TPA: hypothetical protein VMJ35_04825 [Dongiaceae bacterium]|nr:hypothetical protein [Dongiaceae bacterium]